MNRIKRLIPVIAIIAAAICFFAFRGADSNKIRISQEELAVVAETADESFFVSSAARDEMQEIASSGMLKMYLDKSTMTVCVYDIISGVLYRSLPQKYAGEKPSVLTVGVLLQGREYILSSQNDSVSFSCAEYAEIENGITVTYSFRRSIDGAGKLDISVPVSYVLTDGMLTVSVECADICCDGKAVITSISLMDYFGADNKGKKGDYILLSEGSGAIIDLSESADNFEEVCLPVYGGDPAAENESDYNVTVGAFGRKSGSSAVVCLVSEGEAICEIRACKALVNGGYNRAGASFNITPVSVTDKHIYVSRKSYEGTLQLCYRFLSGDSADYIGMASAVRELLIRQGRLRENVLSQDGEYPFNLSLIMSRESPDEGGKNKTQELTSFTQAYELLDSLKAKGFGNMNVRLSGVSEKEKMSVYSPTDKTGEKAHLLSLADDASISFYSDSLLYSSDNTFAKSLDGNKLQYISAAEFSDSLNDYIGRIRKQNVSGVCIVDAGEILCSDFSGGRVALREKVKNSLGEIFSAVCASKSLMISGGNLYSIKYADTIINLPSSSSLSYREDISDVPFIQAILHGITAYSHEAANMADDSVSAMLRAAEYGALPHFEWHCTPSDENEDADKGYYMDSISQAKAYYDKMKSDFADLKGKRITAHKQIKNDVYLTRFGEDCSVYVNYSDNPVSVAGITVSAKSYAVVN